MAQDVATQHQASLVYKTEFLGDHESEKESGMVTSTLEAEVEKLRVQCHPGLQSETLSQKTTGLHPACAAEP